MYRFVLGVLVVASLFALPAAFSGAAASEGSLPVPVALFFPSVLDSLITPSRVAFLGLGLAALGSAYHQAWKNWRA